MTWTYSGDPNSSELDELRFTVQDTDEKLKLLTDEELNFLLDQWMPRFDSITYVASVAAAVISRKFAGIVNVSSDGVSVNTADLAQRYRDLAAELRAQYKDAQVGGVLDLANLMVGTTPDPSIAPLRFGVGLHDNPEAGLQDFGGWTYDPFRAAEEIAVLWGL